jgi:hypothetical protein
MGNPATNAHLIELNISDMHQLFNSMDPAPFHDKDLDRDAEEFIVSWSREYPPGDPVTLRVHLGTWPDTDPTAVIRDAVHHYFAYRAKLSDLEFKRLMRQGRASLGIGLLFLAACLTASAMLGNQPATVTGYLRESLTIAGWVAMWRPMEIYLYDWWPVRRQWRNYLKLSVMSVEVVARG